MDHPSDDIPELELLNKRGPERHKFKLWLCRRYSQYRIASELSSDQTGGFFWTTGQLVWLFPWFTPRKLSTQEYWSVLREVQMIYLRARRSCGGRSM